MKGVGAGMFLHAMMDFFYFVWGRFYFVYGVCLFV